MKPLKPVFKTALQGMSYLFGSSESYRSLGYFSRKLTHSFSFTDTVHQALSLFGSFSIDELSLLTGHPAAKIKDIILGDLGMHTDKRKNEDPISTLQYLLAKLYLKDGVLVKVDRASMANSLEVRSPFLDHDLVEFAFRSIPSRDKLRGFRVKHILKEAFANSIPASIIKRPKQGFAMPLSHWLRTSFKGQVEEKLSKDALSRTGFFHADYVKNIVKEHMESRNDHRKKIWNLLMFQYWAEKHL